MRQTILLFFAIILILGCEKEEDFEFEKKLIKSYEFIYYKERLLFFYNNDSTLNKIEYFYLDKLRKTFEFRYNYNNKNISEIEEYTAELFDTINNNPLLPYHNVNKIHYNEINIIDSIIIIDKESSVVKEKRYFYYNSNNLSRIVTNYIERNIVVENDFIFENGNLYSILDDYEYDTKINPFFNLNLYILHIPPLLNNYEILSKNNLVRNQNVFLGDEKMEIDYYNNYPVKKTNSVASHWVYKYEYY